MVVFHKGPIKQEKSDSEEAMAVKKHKAAPMSLDVPQSSLNTPLLDSGLTP